MREMSGGVNSVRMHHRRNGKRRRMGCLWGASIVGRCHKGSYLIASPSLHLGPQQVWISAYGASWQTSPSAALKRIPLLAKKGCDLVVALECERAISTLEAINAWRSLWTRLLTNRSHLEADTVSRDHVDHRLSDRDFGTGAAGVIADVILRRVAAILRCGRHFGPSHVAARTLPPHPLCPIIPGPATQATTSTVVLSPNPPPP